MAAPQLTALAVFHAQQAAEKATKGYLLALGGTPVPRTHLLRQFIALLRDRQAALPPAESVRFLDTYGVSVRYPDSEPPPDEATAVARTHAETIVAFVQGQLTALDQRDND